MDSLVVLARGGPCGAPPEGQDPFAGRESRHLPPGVGPGVGATAPGFRIWFLGGDLSPGPLSWVCPGGFLSVRPPPA